MNRHQQLMLITAEECGELVQRCSKMIRHAERAADVEDKQRTKFVEEVGDVLGMIMLIVKHGYATMEELEERIKVKHDKLRTWSDLLDGE